MLAAGGEVREGGKLGDGECGDKCLCGEDAGEVGCRLGKGESGCRRDQGLDERCYVVAHGYG